MDTLTIILIVAIIIFVIAAVVLIVMLVGNPSEGRAMVPMASDRTLPGTNRKTAAPGAMVVVLQGKNQGKRAVFRSDRITIGRGSDCTILMDEPLVSRIHAEVKFDNGHFTLEDPGSANGIWMHGQRVLQVELKDGDQFRIGRSVFAFVLPGGAVPTDVRDDERPQQRVRKAPQTNLPGYALEQKLSEGGQAIVYKAREESSGNDVVIKYLSNLPYDADGQYFRMKFEQQIAIGTTIRHPYCVQILGGNAKTDVPYLIEEYLPGGTLGEKLQGSVRVPQKEIVQIIGQMCDALAYLHGRGIIHRDVAPSNIMFDGRNRARLIDFGIARLSGAPTRTAMGMLVGKARYMSIEQARGETAVAQSDLYSLGIIAYQMAVGKVPFEGNDLDVIKAHLEAKPQRPRELVPSLPEALDNAIMKALEKDPGRRFSSAADMALAFGYNIPLHPTGEVEGEAEALEAAAAVASASSPSSSSPSSSTASSAAKNGLFSKRPGLKNLTTGSVIPVTRERFILSRDSINHKDKTISRQNGHIFYQDQLWWIGELNDARSQNGIYLNGTRVVEPQIIRVGDTIRLGETQLEVIN